jgi:hypothetical protein
MRQTREFARLALDAATSAKAEATDARITSSRSLQLLASGGASESTPAARHTAYSTLYQRLVVGGKIQRRHDVEAPAVLTADLPPVKFFPVKQTSVVRGDPESALQNYGNGQLRLAVRAAARLDFYDTSGRAVFPSGDMPDNTFTAPSLGLSATAVVTVVEWKKFEEKKRPQFSDTEKGQPISYGLEILDAQHWRASVIVSICNLDIIQFFEVSRGDRVVEFAPVPFLEGCGRGLLWSMLQLEPDRLGFAVVYPTGVARDSLVPIAGGATSIVFRSVGRGEAAASSSPAADGMLFKAFRASEEESRRRELAAYEILGDDAKAHNVSCFVREGSNYIVVKDAGSPMTALDPSVVLGDVVRALRYAHGMGLVHRDVRPANIAVRGDRATLIDWGSAIALVDVASHNVVGTRSLASDHVRQNPTAFRFADDLHGVIRTLIFLKELHGLGLPRSDDAEQLTAFWQALQLPLHYRELIAAAERCDYNFLIRALSKVPPFPARSPPVVAIPLAPSPPLPNRCPPTLCVTTCFALDILLVPLLFPAPPFPPSSVLF